MQERGQYLPLDPSRLIAPPLPGARLYRLEKDAERAEAEDRENGATFIPYLVTRARKEGATVPFVRDCSSRNCWHWALPDGSRIFNFDAITFARIGRENGRKAILGPGTIVRFDAEDGAGACPECGNPHTMGGTVPKGTD